MTQMPPPQNPQMMHGGELPGATTGLVLGICSLVFSAPIVGLILAWLGYSKSRDAKALGEQNPGAYTNLGVAQAGYIVSIIGMIMGGLSTVCGCGYLLIFIVIGIGAAAGGAGGAGP